MGHSNATSLRREFDVPKATVETAMESPEDGGADVEGVGKRSAERLLNVGCIVSIMRNSQSWTNEPTHVD